MQIVLNVAFVIAAVAFFKQQLELKGYWPIVCAFLISLVVAFEPDLVALFPAVQPYVEKFVTVVALFLSAPGVFDLAVDVGTHVTAAVQPGNANVNLAPKPAA